MKRDHEDEDDILSDVDDFAAANGLHNGHAAVHDVTGAGRGERKRRRGVSLSPGQARTVHERASKGLIEKRRRDRINTSLSELSKLVPAAREKNDSKLEKAEILQLTVEHLRSLAEDSNNASPAQQHNLDYRLVGFQECMTELVRYLSHIEGITPNNSLHIRLVSHLQSHAGQIALSQQKQRLVNRTSPPRGPVPLTPINPPGPILSAVSQPIGSPSWRSSCPPTPTLSPTNFTIPNSHPGPPHLTAGKPSRPFQVQAMQEAPTLTQGFPPIIALPTQLPPTPMTNIASPPQDTKPGSVYNYGDFIAVPGLKL